MNKLNILVVDDNPIHQEAARLQLGAIHNLTVVGTYGEALEFLQAKCDYEKARSLLEDKLGPRKSDLSNEEYSIRYDREGHLQNECATWSPAFDIVLADLLMPSSGWIEKLTQGSPHRGAELPIGIFLGLLAARGGVKKVAVFTDSNHHAHPASVCMDAFNPGGEHVPFGFPVGGSTLYLCNGRGFVDTCSPQDITRPLSYEEYQDRTDTVSVKNWKKLLDYVLSH